MNKSIVKFLTIIIFLFLLIPARNAQAATTTCQDSKTARISGTVWQSITYGNRNTSVGLKDATVRITRGVAPNQESIDIKTGGAYKYVSPGVVQRLSNFSTQDQGIYDLCGFIYDADIYKATGGQPNANTVFSVQVIGVPTGYSAPKTVFPPLYTQSRGSTIGWTQNYQSKADTANGATAYVNQIGNSNAKPIPGVGGTVTTCNQLAPITSSGQQYKYRCDFISSKNTVERFPVGGKIVSSNGSPIPNLKVNLFNGTAGTGATVTTKADGTFRQDNFVAAQEYYAVRVDLSTVTSAKFLTTPGTTNNTRSNDTYRKANTPYGSVTYENQQFGNKSCSEQGNSLTCNFMYNIPVTPSPTPVPVYEPVGGTVKSTTGVAIPNILVEVHNETINSVRGARTNTSGAYRIDNFVQKGHKYSVVVDVRAITNLGYLNTPGTSNNTRSYSTCTKANVPAGSYSYTCQQQGTNSCSIVNSLSCNFVYAKPATQTPSPRVVTPPPPTQTPSPRVVTPPPPTPTPTPQVCEANPADIVLILDQSSSIEKDIASEKFAAVSFVRGLSETTGGKTGKIRIGVVSYNKVATRISELTTIVPGSTQLTQLINGINAVAYASKNNGTCINCAETMANSLLSGSKATTKSVILISDGRANAPGISEEPYPKLNQPMVDAVNTAKNSGYTYYAVGYGSASRTRGDVLSAITEDSAGIGNVPTVNASLLNTACAYPPAPYKNEESCNYDYEPNPQKWVESFADIGGEICPAYKTRVLKAAGVQITSDTTQSSRQMGFFEFAFQVVRDLVSGKYLDDVFAGR